MRVLLAAAAVMLVPAIAPATAQAQQAQTRATARLAVLFKDSDEASLRRNPLDALYRGDLRYATQFGDYVTPAYWQAERAAAESELARLKQIDRSKLSPTDQLAYDVFQWQTE